MADWRVENARSTRGLAFTWRVYKALRPDWDHDHCEGCTAKFAELDEPEVLHEGYASDARYKDRPGYYDWVCADCFNDLQDQMGWTRSGS